MIPHHRILSPILTLCGLALGSVASAQPVSAVLSADETNRSSQVASSSASAEDYSRFLASLAGGPRGMSGTIQQRSPVRKSRLDFRATAVISNQPGPGPAAAEPPATKIEAPASPWRFSVSTGYQSRFIYHGLDIVGFNSIGFSQLTRADGMPASQSVNDQFRALTTGSRTSDVASVEVSASYHRFRFAVGYLAALETTVPITQFRRAFIDSFSGNPLRTPESARYTEVQLRAEYAIPLGSGFEATIGYGAFLFPVRSFRNTVYQGEAFGRIAYTNIPFTTLSLSGFYYHSDARIPRVKFVDAPAGTPVGSGSNGSNFFIIAGRLGTLTRGENYLNGGYFEFKAESRFPIISPKGPLLVSDTFLVGLLPYVLVSYNAGYSSAGYPGGSSDLERILRGIDEPDQARYFGFNTVELGLSVPINYKSLTITPSINYGVNIAGNKGRSNAFGQESAPVQQRVWGGVEAKVSF